MGVILLPQRHLVQPQYIAPVDKGNDLASGLVSALVFDNQGTVVDRVAGTKYPVTNAVTRVDGNKKVLYFDGTGDYVNTGAQTLGGVNLFADSTSKWSVVICARLETSGVGGSFLSKCGATGTNRTFQIYRDPGFSNADPAIWLRGGVTANELNWDWNTADWHQYTVTWDGTTAMAYGDYDKSNVLTVGAAAQEAENIVFGARTGGSAFLLTGRLAYGYFYNRAISRQESIELFQNPSQVFQAPARRIYISSGATSYTLTADAGSFALTGTAATLKYGRTLSAASGSFAVTGTAATLRKGYSLQAASGSFAATGTAATLRYGRVIQAAAGSFGVTGTAASLKYGRVLTAAPGSFQISGTDATLTYGTAGSYTLTAQPGSFSVSGTAATLRYGRKLSADSGSFAFTGTAATLRYARRVIAESGTFRITGTDATLDYSSGADPVTSTVERTAIFRATVARSTKFQRSKSATVRFN